MNKKLKGLIFGTILIMFADIECSSNAELGVDFVFNSSPEQLRSTFSTSNVDQIFATLKLKNKQGQTALFLADKATLDIMLKRLSPDQKLDLLKTQDKDGKTAFFGAAKDRLDPMFANLNSDQMLDLLRIQDKDGRTALWGATSEQITIMFKNLNADQKRRINLVKDKYERYAFWYAKNLQELLPFEINESILNSVGPGFLAKQDSYGLTCLHFIDDPEAIKSLLKSAAPSQIPGVINIRDKDGATALVDASKEKIAALLDRVPEDQKSMIVKIANNAGRTAS